MTNTIAKPRFEEVVARTQHLTPTLVTNGGISLLRSEGDEIG